MSLGNSDQVAKVVKYSRDQSPVLEQPRVNTIMQVGQENRLWIEKDKMYSPYATVTLLDGNRIKIKSDSPYGGYEIRIRIEDTPEPVAADTDDRVGGIDFNPALFNLEVRRDENGVPLPLPQQPIYDMNINGFMPIIIEVVPITNLQFLLGMKIEDEEIEHVSMLD